MTRARALRPEYLLLVAVVALASTVATRPRAPRPERHIDAPVADSGVVAQTAVTLGEHPADAGASSPSVSTPRCLDAHGAEAPSLRTLASRALIEPYSQEVIRLPASEPIPRGYVLVRSLRLDPAIDGARGTVELHNHRSLVARSHSVRASRWIFNEASAGGDCRDHRVVLRWLDEGGAVRDQVSILSGYADVRLSDTPTRALRSIWLEHDNCHPNHRVQSHQLRLFDLRSGQFSLAVMVDDRGEFRPLVTRNSVASRWSIEPHATHNELFTHEVELYESTRGAAHNRCIETFWRLRFDGACWRGSAERARVAGTEGASECEVIEVIPSIENIVRSMGIPAGGDGTTPSDPGEPPCHG